MIKGGIIGGGGYRGGEVIGVVVNDGDVEIGFMKRWRNGGKKISEVEEGLYGESDLVFRDEVGVDRMDVLLLCRGEGDRKKLMESENVGEDLKMMEVWME